MTGGSIIFYYWNSPLQWKSGEFSWTKALASYIWNEKCTTNYRFQSHTLFNLPEQVHCCPQARHHLNQNIQTCYPPATFWETFCHYFLFYFGVGCIFDSGHPVTCFSVCCIQSICTCHLEQKDKGLVMVHCEWYHQFRIQITAGIKSQAKIQHAFFWY